MNFKDIKNKFMEFVADIRYYKLGLILLGESSYQIKGPHIREILDVLEPGDVLFRRYNHYLGTLFVPGKWPHVAIYIGNGKVIHMLFKGITEEDILTFTRTDNMAIYRHDNKDMAIQAAVEAQKVLETHRKYDFEFEDDDDEWYCSELIKFCYKLDITEKIIYPDYYTKLDCFYKVWSKE